MPKLIVGGIPVDVEDVYVNELCDQMKENKIDVSKVFEWYTQTKVCFFILFYLFSTLANIVFHEYLIILQKFITIV